MDVWTPKEIRNLKLKIYRKNKESKKCKKCNRTKELKHFNLNRKLIDGFHYYCRECCKKYMVVGKKYERETKSYIDEEKMKTSHLDGGFGLYQDELV